MKMYKSDMNLVCLFIKITVIYRLMKCMSMRIPKRVPVYNNALMINNNICFCY